MHQSSTLADEGVCIVLDSALAKPAKGITVGLQRYRKIADDGGSFAFDPIAHG